MATKEEKCEFCGCRGESTICYYNCGCHKPKDEQVLPKKWLQETAVKLIELDWFVSDVMEKASSRMNLV